MNVNIDYGRTETVVGRFNNKDTSLKETRTKDIKVASLLDAQEKMLSYSKHFIDNGLSADVSFRVVADKTTRQPKRIEVTWVTQSEYVPVRRPIEKQ